MLQNFRPRFTRAIYFWLSKNNFSKSLPRHVDSCYATDSGKSRYRIEQLKSSRNIYRTILHLIINFSISYNNLEKICVPQPWKIRKTVTKNYSFVSVRMGNGAEELKVLFSSQISTYYLNFEGRYGWNSVFSMLRKEETL